MTTCGITVSKNVQKYHLDVFNALSQSQPSKML